jgi:myo-inositol 2-dehydrogenase / D-chiro-inositol 1-dehydrogenase
MKQITVGVIGTGRIGTIHAGNLAHMPGVQLKAVADPLVVPSEWEDRGVEALLDPHALIADADIDAVLVCSPTPTHAELTMAAAEAGKHVFCEKPIDLEPGRIRQTLEVVERSGVQLQVGFNRRFDPTFARLRRAVVDGEVGDLHMVKIVARDPAPPPAEYVRDSGGMFLDMTIHDFDMVRFLSGSEVLEVHAFGAVLVDPAIGEAGDVDTAVVTMKLANGGLAVIENSRRAVFGYDQRIEVFGSRGGIEAMNEYPFQVRQRTARGERKANPLYFFLQRYQRSFVAEVETFIDSVRQGRTPPVTGRDGLIPVLIGLAATESMRSHRPVRVESP